MPIDFSVAVGRWVDKAKQKSEAAFRGIAEEAVGRVKELTPVKTGFLRANWNATVSQDAMPKQAGQSKNDISLAKVGDVIYVTNPVPYARRIEYGFTGTDTSGKNYNVPGRGMVQQTVTEIPKMADAVVRRLKDGGA